MNQLLFSSYYPTVNPSYNPTVAPSYYPTIIPSQNPTTFPSYYPTTAPSYNPTNPPTPSSATSITIILYSVNVTIILSPPPSPNITSQIIDILNETAAAIIADNPQNCLEKSILDTVITEKTNFTIISASIQVCDQETHQTLYTSYNDWIKDELIKEYN